MNAQAVPPTPVGGSAPGVGPVRPAGVDWPAYLADFSALSLAFLLGYYQAQGRADPAASRGGTPGPSGNNSEV